VDEAAAGTAVAVGERVDRLELGVGQRGLQRGREVVAVHEPGEAVEQPVDLVRRRGDEGAAVRVVVVAADPVLGGARDARDVRVAGLLHQRAVHVDERGHGDRRGARGDRDRVLRGGDVGQDRVGARAAVLVHVGDRRLGQAAVGHDQALDPRGGDRLLAQQLAGKGLEARDAGDVRVELPDRFVGLVEHPRH